MNWLETLVMAAAVPAAASVSAFLIGPILEQGRRKRAYRRLKADPHMKVGSSIKEIQLSGRDKPVCGKCKVTVFAVGVVEVTTEAGHHIRFTGREFEELIPVYHDADTHGKDVR